jgi:dextranase
VNHGAPQSLSYAKGSDGTGTYITFTVPSLLYWDMVWLELDSLSTSDYATP